MFNYLEFSLWTFEQNLTLKLKSDVILVVCSKNMKIRVREHTSLKEQKPGTRVQVMRSIVQSLLIQILLTSLADLHITEQ